MNQRTFLLEHRRIILALQAYHSKKLERKIQTQVRK